METRGRVVGASVSSRRSFGVPAAETLVPELVEEFNSATEWGAVVQLVLTRAVTDTCSDRGVISWIDGNEMVVAGCHDPFGEPVEVGSRWPLAGDQVSAVALAAGRPRSGRFDEVGAEGSASLHATYAGLEHLLVVPVSVAGEHIAILCVSRRGSEPFAAADSAVLECIACVGAQPLRAARLDDMLGAALTELSERLASAESVERVKTDILRLASHELRSPLTVLNGYLSLIRAGHFGEIPEPLDRIMRILERRTAEMNGLVNDMLIAARVDDGPSEAVSQTVDMRTLVSCAADAVAQGVTAQHRLALELPGHPVTVSVDSERVVLALRNILDNAVKYSPNGGDVVCTLFERDGTACVAVSDHGLGIAVADRDKLFTRFGRVLTAANSHIPGIGLGLYFTREVARRHGGDVRLVEGDPPGCTFELSLPLHRVARA